MLNNMSVGKKIGLGFTLVIGILVLVAGVGWLGIEAASDGFVQYRGIAQDNVLMGRVQANLLEARLQVENFIQTGDDKAANEFNERYESAGKFIAEAEEGIQNPDRAKLVAAIRAAYTEYGENFKKVIAARDARNQAVLETMNPKGLAMRQRLTEIMEFAYKDNDPEAAYYAGRMQEHVLLGRLYAMKFLDTNSEADASRVREELNQKLSSLVTELDRRLDNPQRRSLLENFKTERESYIGGFEQAVSVIKERNEMIASKLDVLGPQIAEKAGQVKLSIKEEQDTLGPAVQAGNERTETLTVVVAVIGAVVAILFGFFVSRRITRPIIELKETALNVAKGDLNQRIALDQNDEMGELANAFKTMVENLKQKETAEAENKRMVDGVIDAVADTATKFQKGALAARAESRDATGPYREMLDTFNGALEAVIGPLNVSADYLRRISQGDIPPQLRDQYHGDFKDIADSINRCIDALWRK